MGYITGEREEGCFLCNKAQQEPSKENFIIGRWEKCFALLNTYPYNNGHTMIAPYRHVGDYEKLDEGEMVGIAEALKRVLGALRVALKPDGFNVGINLGEAAGAGVPGHMHVHIVPRWAADTNFMLVLGDTKVIPQALEETWRLVREALERQAAEGGA